MNDRTSLELHAERPVVGGAMLARHEGRVVRVFGAIPGGHVRVRIDRERRDVVYATVIDAIITPDADRRIVSGDPAYRHIAYQCSSRSSRKSLVMR